MADGREHSSFISARYANGILSDVRPTRIHTDTLFYLNAYLDELLLLILTSARSLATDRIKTDGLLKVLNNAIGKNAVLEAELELRSYYNDKRQGGGAVPLMISAGSRWDGTSEWPVGQAFDMLRLRCQYYSTLGDRNEDEAEAFAGDQPITNANGQTIATVTPGVAIYVTALLEFVGEYVLQNVSRVIERDNANSARLVDLFNAFIEDESLAGLFNRMRVKRSIEDRLRAEDARRPRRATKDGAAPAVGVAQPWHVPDEDEYDQAISPVWRGARASKSPPPPPLARSREGSLVSSSNAHSPSAYSPTGPRRAGTRDSQDGQSAAFGSFSTSLLSGSTAGHSSSTSPTSYNTHLGSAGAGAGAGPGMGPSSPPGSMQSHSVSFTGSAESGPGSPPLSALSRAESARRSSDKGAGVFGKLLGGGGPSSSSSSSAINSGSGAGAGVGGGPGGGAMAGEDKPGGVRRRGSVKALGSGAARLSKEAARGHGAAMSVDTIKSDGPNGSKSNEEDDFEALMMSGQTMKVSLTPNRLRTIEIHEREAQAKKLARRRPGALDSIRSNSDISLVPSSRRSPNQSKLIPRGPSSPDPAALSANGEMQSHEAEPQETLQDILSQPPPWTDQTSGALAPALPTKSPARSATMPLSPTSPTGATDVAKAVRSPGASRTSFPAPPPSASDRKPPPAPPAHAPAPLPSPASGEAGDDMDLDMDLDDDDDDLGLGPVKPKRKAGIPGMSISAIRARVEPRDERTRSESNRDLLEFLSSPPPGSDSPLSPDRDERRSSMSSSVGGTTTGTATGTAAAAGSGSRKSTSRFRNLVGKFSKGTSDGTTTPSDLGSPKSLTSGAVGGGFSLRSRTSSVNESVDNLSLGPGSVSSRSAVGGGAEHGPPMSHSARQAASLGKSFAGSARTGSISSQNHHHHYQQQQQQYGLSGHSKNRSLAPSVGSIKSAQTLESDLGGAYANPLASSPPSTRPTPPPAPANRLPLSYALSKTPTLSDPHPDRFPGLTHAGSESPAAEVAAAAHSGEPEPDEGAYTPTPTHSSTALADGQLPSSRVGVGVGVRERTTTQATLLAAAARAAAVQGLGNGVPIGAGTAAAGGAYPYAPPVAAAADAVKAQQQENVRAASFELSEASPSASGFEIIDPPVSFSPVEHQHRSRSSSLVRSLYELEALMRTARSAADCRALLHEMMGREGLDAAEEEEKGKKEEEEEEEERLLSGGPAANGAGATLGKLPPSKSSAAAVAAAAAAATVGATVPELEPEEEDQEREPIGGWPHHNLVVGWLLGGDESPVVESELAAPANGKGVVGRRSSTAGAARKARRAGSGAGAEDDEEAGAEADVDTDADEASGLDLDRTGGGVGGGVVGAGSSSAIASGGSGATSPEKGARMSLGDEASGVSSYTDAVAGDDDNDDEEQQQSERDEVIVDA